MKIHKHVNISDLHAGLTILTKQYSTFTQKNFWVADGKMARSLMGKCDLPVSDQFFGPIWTNFTFFEPTFGPRWIS